MWVLKQINQGHILEKFLAYPLVPVMTNLDVGTERRAWNLKVMKTSCGDGGCVDTIEYHVVTHDIYNLGSWSVHRLLLVVTSLLGRWSVHTQICINTQRL